MREGRAKRLGSFAVREQALGQGVAERRCCRGGKEPRRRRIDELNGEGWQEPRSELQHKLRVNAVDATVDVDVRSIFTRKFGQES